MIKTEDLKPMPSPSVLNENLRHLWIACFFERRLTKPLIQSLDLKHTLHLIHSLLAQSKLDFKQSMPLLYGLTRLFHRQMQYLQQESKSVLEQLDTPFEEKAI